MSFGRAAYGRSPYGRLIVPASGGGGGTAYSLTAANGSFALTGKTTSRAIGFGVGFGAFALTGKTTARAITLGASFGAFTFTGEPATLTKSGSNSYSLAAAFGAFALAGKTVSFPHGRTLTAAQGSFAITGKTTSRGISMSALVGLYSLTGLAATFLKHGPAAYTLTAQFGQFLISGQAARTLFSNFSAKEWDISISVPVQLSEITVQPQEQDLMVAPEPGQNIVVIS